MDLDRIFIKIIYQNKNKTKWGRPRQSAVSKSVMIGEGIMFGVEGGGGAILIPTSVDGLIMTVEIDLPLLYHINYSTVIQRNVFWVSM